MNLNKAVVIDLGPPTNLTPSGLDPLVCTVMRALRHGQKVIAVASAPTEHARADLAAAEHLGVSADLHARAMLSLASTIETSEKLTEILAFAAGVRVGEVDARKLLPVTRGNPLDAQPRHINAGLYNRVFADADAIVIPGGIGLSVDARPTSLGEGGTLLTGLFIADTLGLPLELRARSGTELGPIGKRKARLFADAHGINLQPPQSEALGMCI